MNFLSKSTCQTQSLPSQQQGQLMFACSAETITDTNTLTPSDPAVSLTPVPSPTAAAGPNQQAVAAAAAAARQQQRPTVKEVRKLSSASCQVPGTHRIYLPSMLTHLKYIVNGIRYQVP